MNLLQALNTPVNTRVRSPTAAASPTVLPVGPAISSTGHSAEKLSVVFACMEIRANDIATLPCYVFNRYTKERKADHPALSLLNIRPNVRMTPFIRAKLSSWSVDALGNAYDWLLRNPGTGEIEEIIPITGDLVQRFVDKQKNIWYQVTDPITSEIFYLPQEDVCDYKGPTRDGFNGLSILSFASEVTASGLAAQAYNRAFYENGGQPSGVLTVDSDLQGFVPNPDGTMSSKRMKEVIREEWEKFHSGAANSHRIAILDHGLKYQSLSISQKDAMFIEQQSQTVEDIARYFSMPLYKVQHGKQSYNSNEQNAIEYAGTLRPVVVQREQEMTWKMLTPSEIHEGWEIRLNMMALLRSDPKTRWEVYRMGREIGPYSVNDIRALEDLPDVAGGDFRAASLNYVPLELWPELSTKRAGGGNNNDN